MPHKVFISYSLEDKLVADAACAALEAQRIPCWIAPRDILTLQENHATISDMMAHCQIVLLIYSAASIDSPDLRCELELAINLGKIIEPFLIEIMPSDNSLQLAKSRTHWLDVLSPALESNLAKLCGTITNLMAQLNSAEPPQWRLHDQVDELTAISAGAPETVSPEMDAETKIRESTAIPFTRHVTNPVAQPLIRQTAGEIMEPLATRVASEPNLLKPVSQTIDSWPSTPQSQANQRGFAFCEEADEPVELNRFWNSSRITFTVLLCLVSAFILFLFLRESGQRSAQENSTPGITAHSPVAPYIKQSLSTPSVAQPIQMNADSVTVMSESSQKEPAVAMAKAEPSISGPSTHNANDQKFEQQPKTDPPYQGAAAESKVARADSESKLTWTDAATGLMWTKEDSGESTDLSWNSAIEYCKNLQLEGHSDWRLPAIGELEGIFDPNSTMHSNCCGGHAKDLHVKGGLQLTGWVWSSTPGDSAQTAVYLSFDNADEYTASIGSSFTLRALCVRKAK